MRGQRSGRAREADLGIAAGSKRGHLFVKGRNVAVVPEAEMVEALVEWAAFIHEHGTDAAIAASTPRSPSAEAAEGPRQAPRRPGPRREPLERADRRDPPHHRQRLIPSRATGRVRPGDQRCGAGELVTSHDIPCSSSTPRRKR
ncbi:MAG: hypothetical protein R2713_00335 [Ilumatobacteraceae bacterium]